MVVECIGLPGSGKTYLLSSVEAELREKGIPCVNAGERSMRSVWWKAGKKVLHRTIFLDRDAREIRERIRQILEKAGQEAQAGRSRSEERTGRMRQEDGIFPLQSRYGINTDERFTVESAAIFAAAYRLMERSEKVYLFDEGLVHTIVKFCAEFHLPESVFLEMMAACGPFDELSRIVVHNRISVDDCVRSIQMRNRHICAFDELPEEKLRELLEQYAGLNACYAARYPVLTVSRTEDEAEKRKRICGGIFRKRTGSKRFRR